MIQVTLVLSFQITEFKEQLLIYTNINYFDLFDLNDVVSDLVEEVAMLAMSAKVKLKSEIRVEQPLQIIGDEDQIYRLISNLIINGIQYTSDGREVTVGF